MTTKIVHAWNLQPGDIVFLSGEPAERIIRTITHNGFTHILSTRLNNPLHDPESVECMQVDTIKWMIRLAVADISGNSRPEDRRPPWARYGS